MTSESPASAKTAGLTESVLRELVASGLALGVRVIRSGDAGFIVVVELGTGQAQLLATRGEPRVFSSLDTAASAVARLGVTEFLTQLSAPTSPAGAQDPSYIKPSQAAL